jgi:hypothetical protein
MIILAVVSILFLFFKEGKQLKLNKHFGISLTILFIMLLLLLLAFHEKMIKLASK